MRVLHAYSGNLFGGVETMLVTLARHRDLCPAMETHVALCFAGRLSDALRTAGIPVHLVGPVRLRRPWTVLQARQRLRECLRRWQFDVVICHAAWSHAIFGPVVRAMHRPLVFWLHGATTGQHGLERWARRTQPDLALCNSRYTAGTLVNMYPAVRSAVLYCPLARPSWDPSARCRSTVRAALQTSEDATVIIQAGRLEPAKGHLMHLEALGRTHDLPGWVCWQVGGVQRPREARYLRQLRMTAQRLGIAKRVHFLGQRSDLPQLLAAADVYCQPNVHPEGFGLAFVEALAAGLPVVSTHLGGAVEIVTPTCGMLVPPGDVTSLADALRSVMVNPGLRSRLGAAGPARARQLSDPATVLSSLANLLSQLVGTWQGTIS